MHTFQINILIQFLVSHYTFRASRVHHQEDYLYMQLFVLCFSCICVSSLTDGRMYSIQYRAQPSTY